MQSYQEQAQALSLILTHIEEFQLKLELQHLY